jgi:hypothetical protein
MLVYQAVNMPAGLLFHIMSKLMSCELAVVALVPFQIPREQTFELELVRSLGQIHGHIVASQGCHC